MIRGMVMKRRGDSEFSAESGRLVVGEDVEAVELREQYRIGWNGDEDPEGIR